MFNRAALQAHLANNASAIEEQAQQYARDYQCSIEIARHDVRDEYVQGFAIEADAARYGDLDR